MFIRDRNHTIDFVKQVKYLVFLPRPSLATRGMNS